MKPHPQIGLVFISLSATMVSTTFSSSITCLTRSRFSVSVAYKSLSRQLLHSFCRCSSRAIFLLVSLICSNIVDQANFLLSIDASRDGACNSQSLRFCPVGRKGAERRESGSFLTFSISVGSNWYSSFVKQVLAEYMPSSSSRFQIFILRLPSNTFTFTEGKLRT